MGFIEAIKTCFRKYATFSGRAMRSEFWYFVLFLVIGNFVLGILDGILAFAIMGATPDETEYDLLTLLFTLATVVPMLAVTWRRLHDINFSGWWIMPSIVSYVAYTALLFYLISIVDDLELETVEDIIAIASFHPEPFMTFIGAFVVFLISSIAVLIMCCLRGSDGENKYGGLTNQPEESVTPIE